MNLLDFFPSLLQKPTEAMHKSFKTEDEQLIEQYRSGNQLALQQLVQRWHKSFCEKAYWLTKDADSAKDIAQESWNTIIVKMDTLKDAGSFQSWALRIVFTKAMDWTRVQQRNKNKLESYHKQCDAKEEEKEDNEGLKQELLKAIKALTEEHQVVLRLFYVEDYSLRDISELLELSVGTVKSRLFHARENLKQKLKKQIL